MMKNRKSEMIPTFFRFFLHVFSASADGRFTRMGFPAVAAGDGGLAE
jgi:hypothetical protein